MVLASSACSSSYSHILPKKRSVVWFQLTFIKKRQRTNNTDMRNLRTHNFPPTRLKTESRGTSTYPSIVVYWNQYLICYLTNRNIFDSGDQYITWCQESSVFFCVLFIQRRAGATDGLIFKGETIVIPQASWKDILSQIHEGHHGIERSKLRTRDFLFLPGMTKQVQRCKHDSSTPAIR